MSDYLVFAKTGDTGKTYTWDVLSKSGGYVLGRIKWHGPWRQYTFLPAPETIWNSGCLVDVDRFMKSQMAARR